jgi:hypothetical protein
MCCCYIRYMYKLERKLETFYSFKTTQITRWVAHHLGPACHLYSIPAIPVSLRGGRHAKLTKITAFWNVAVLFVTTFLLSSILEQQQNFTNDEEDTLDTRLIAFFTAENRTNRVVNSLNFPCLFRNLQIKKTSLDVVHKVLILVEKTEGKNTWKTQA